MIYFLQKIKKRRNFYFIKIIEINKGIQIIKCKYKNICKFYNKKRCIKCKPCYIRIFFKGYLLNYEKENNKKKNNKIE